MIDLDVDIADDRWTPLDPAHLSARCRDALVAEAPAGIAPGEVSLLFADDDTVRGLNRAWRDKDRPTNVLSFPAEALPGWPADAPKPLGDIALATETCTREAAEKGVPAADHTAHLVVHGLLHLIGYDHTDDESAATMEGLERAILARLGIGDPYADDDNGDVDA